MKTILITGFDPFGGEPINPAWEAVKTMDGYTDGDYKVVTQMVPTVRYKSVDTVKAAAEQCEPDFILCVGQAGGRPDRRQRHLSIGPKGRGTRLARRRGRGGDAIPGGRRGRGRAADDLGHGRPAGARRVRAAAGDRLQVGPEPADGCGGGGVRAAGHLPTGRGGRGVR